MAGGAEVASAFVTLVPSARGFASGIDREIGPDLDRSGKAGGRRFGGVFAKETAGPISGVARIVGGPLLAGFAAVGAINVLGGFVRDARESNRIGALTAQVIKSTGGAAKISAAQVGALATAISNKTGVDDEAIQSGANLLLTFTSVRNEVGKGNDIFNQATQTVTDLSAALGQDTKSSAIQLGKALNDPIKGVTALSRVGVSFTMQQKDQIKTLQSSGNILGAQKVILGELTKEFGGAARAAGTPADRLKVTLGNLGEQIGNVLIPALDAGAAFLTNSVLPALSTAVSFISTRVGPIFTSLQALVVPVFRTIAAAVTSFVTGFTGGTDQAGAASGALSAVAGQLQRAFQTVSAFVTTVVVPAFAQIAATFRADVVPVAQIVSRIFTQSVLPALQRVGQFVVAVLVPAFLRIEATIIRTVVPVVLALARAFVQNVLPALERLYRQFATNVLPVLLRVGAVVVTVGGFLVRLAATILGTVLPPLIRFAGPVLGFLIGVIGSTIGFVFRFIGVLLTIGGTLVRVAATIGSFAGKVLGFFGGIASGVGTSIGKAVSFVANLPRRALSALGNLGSTLLSAGSDLVGGFIQGIKNSAGDLIGAIKSTITDGLPGFVKKALGINSPSRVFMEIGGFVGQGLALGINGTRQDVTAAGLGLVRAAVAQPLLPGSASTLSAAGGGIGGRGGITVTLPGPVSRDLTADDVMDGLRKLEVLQAAFA